MFERKQQIAVKTTVKRMTFTNCSIDSEDGKNGTKQGGTLYGVSGINCDISGGGIRPFLGIAEYPIDGKIFSAPDFLTGVKKVAAFSYTNGAGEEREWVMYVTKRGSVYSCDTSDQICTIENVYFSGEVKILPWTEADGRNKLIFCGENGAYMFDREKRFTALYTGEDGASAAACLFHDRLFFASKEGRLRFCAPLNSEAWEDDADESGYLAFSTDRGALVGLAVLKERIYVFFERGIVKLDARGAARDFVAESLPYGGGTIFFGSVGETDGKVYFLATDGVYVFDGEEAKILSKTLPVYPKREGQVCDHTVFEGKYYLDYTDVGGESKRLVLDGRTGTAFFMTATPDGISGTNGKLLCHYDSKIRVFGEAGELPEGEQFVLKKDYTDFGLPGRKLLRSMTVKGKGGMRLEVSNGYEKHGYTLTLSDGERKVFPLVKGEKFSLKILPERGSEIRSLGFEFHLYG